MTALTNRVSNPTQTRSRHRLGIASIAAMALCLSVIGGGCQNDAQTGAAFGAGLGAIGGAIIGHQSGHAGEGAAIGAAAGGLGGYIVGNESDKSKAKQNRDYRY